MQLYLCSACNILILYFIFLIYLFIVWQLDRYYPSMSVFGFFFYVFLCWRNCMGLTVFNTRVVRMCDMSNAADRVAWTPVRVLAAPVCNWQCVINQNWQTMPLIIDIIIIICLLKRMHVVMTIKKKLLSYRYTLLWVYLLVIQTVLYYIFSFSVNRSKPVTSKVLNSSTIHVIGFIFFPLTGLGTWVCVRKQ